MTHPLFAQPKDETAFWDEQKTRQPAPAVDGPTRRSKIVARWVLAMMIGGATLGTFYACAARGAERAGPAFDLNAYRPSAQLPNPPIAGWVGPPNIATYGTYESRETCRHEQTFVVARPEHIGWSLRCDRAEERRVR